MRSLWVAALIGQLAVPALTGQGNASLDQRLDSATLATLRPILDSARADSLPEQALEDKVLEGMAKHVAPPRIVAAVRQLAGKLRDARALLRSATAAAPSEGEIVAAADALRRGVPAAELAALQTHAPTATLVVAFTVLGDLVQRGVPAGQARLVIEQLLAAGVPASQIAEIPSHMDVGLRVGAPPLDALRSALPVPLRPLKPPSPPPPSPKPDRTGPDPLHP